ncbi:MAG: polymerase sigma-70 factor, subfamily [Chloroflexota bacterium]|jgi:RNA polymerase sigma-70 factor (ECF subfamily)|nr:polymerase sigma-70 factor, subfamily [Chloroflexota bacterium]
MFVRMSTREATTTIEEPVALASAAAADLDLGAFIDAHYDRLLGLARLVGRDATDAADAVQVALERAWKERRSLRDPSRLRPWLDRIVVREAIRIDRRRTGLFRLLRPIRQIDVDQPRQAAADVAPELAALRVAFAQLSAEQRAAVALHLHLGYTVAETAVLVGAPEETVRSRLRLARERLRRELEDPH